MIKYILSFDFGSTLFKYLIMKVNDCDISIFKKSYFEDKNCDIIFLKLKKLFEDENIDIDTQLEVVSTGVNAKKINNFYNNKIFYVPEFIALSYGTLLPNNIDEAIIVSVGTGTSYIYSNINETKHISGSGMGGGPIAAISRYFFNESNIEKTCENIKNVDIKNIDTFISDFVDDKEYQNLNKDLTASNMTKINTNSTKEEIVFGIYNMICQNIGIEAIASANIMEREKNIELNTIPIIFVGSITKFELIKKMLNKIGEDLGHKFIYLDNEMHISAIGAYEYYLINERNN